MGHAELQRDLDRAYAHLARVEAEAGRAQREMEVAEARGETEVAKVHKKDLDYQLVRQQTALSDISDIREAMQR
ncbi:MAG TPA: hypothetical protein VF549_08320 [Solirubrobacteraceae bacterium]|jgi:hypothetical protein